MSALRGLSLAIELATRQREEALAALVQAHRALQGAQGQMGQLDSYAAETESHWAPGARNQIGPEIVHHYDQFMVRLQQAVDLQRAVVADQDASLAAARQRVMQAEVRIAGLKRLLEKRQAAQARAGALQEQKQLDELAALQFRRFHPSPEMTEAP